MNVGGGGSVLCFDIKRKVWRVEGVCVICGKGKMMAGWEHV